MMLKVYFLPIEIIEGAERPKGTDYIHDAILECTEKPDIRKLIQDTTVEEDNALTSFALEVRQPTNEERTTFETLPPPTPPPRNLEAEIDNLKARVENLEKAK